MKYKLTPAWTTASFKFSNKEGTDPRGSNCRATGVLRVKNSSSITAKNVSYNWHDPDTSFVEAALSRGDRKIADVIEAVWRAGGRMEAWSDYFRFERWMRAFEDCGLDPAFYASRERGEDEVLPWCRVNMGVRESLLLRERHRAYEAQLSPDCRAACSACGAAALLEEGRCDG